MWEGRSGNLDLTSSDKFFSSLSSGKNMLKNKNVESVKIVSSNIKLNFMEMHWKSVFD